VEIFEREDLIPEEETIVTVSHRGYIKRTRPDEFRAQGRGGKGVIGADVQEDDFVEFVFTASTHDYMMFFTNLGLVYWLKVFMVPQMARTAKGRALVNVLELQEGERITGVIPVREFDEDHYLLMATASGVVKKTSLDAFGKRGSGGIIALGLAEGDQLIGVRMTNGDQDVILGTQKGRAIRFNEQDVRPMGRTASGVRGIRLRKGDSVVDLAVVRKSATLLTVCENGHGKRTEFSEYSTQHRGGQGVIDIKTSARNGAVVAMRETFEPEQLILVTEQGKTVRIPAASVRCIGRNTQGVRLITTDEEDRVSSVAAIVPDDEEDEQEPEVAEEAEAPADDAEEPGSSEDPNP